MKRQERPLKKSNQTTWIEKEGEKGECFVFFSKRRAQGRKKNSSWSFFLGALKFCLPFASSQIFFFCATPVAKLGGRTNERTRALSTPEKGTSRGLSCTPWSASSRPSSSETCWGGTCQSICAYNVRRGFENGGGSSGYCGDKSMTEMMVCVPLDLRLCFFFLCAALLHVFVFLLHTSTQPHSQIRPPPPFFLVEMQGMNYCKGLGGQKGKGGAEGKTYETFLDVHSRFACTSCASCTPSWKRARVRASRACACACSSRSSRCLALSWPELFSFSSAAVYLKADNWGEEDSRLRLPRQTPI